MPSALPDAPTPAPLLPAPDRKRHATSCAARRSGTPAGCVLSPERCAGNAPVAHMTRCTSKSCGNQLWPRHGAPNSVGGVPLAPTICGMAATRSTTAARTAAAAAAADDAARGVALVMFAHLLGLPSTRRRRVLHIGSSHGCTTVMRARTHTHIHSVTHTAAPPTATTRDSR